MIKDILFDADGVTIKKRALPFSQRYAQDLGVPPEAVSEFYRHEYQLCAVGKADLRQEIVKYFSKWQWTKDVDELLDYWFSAEKELDEGVVNLIRVLRGRGVRCHLISDNERYRGEYLLDKVGLRELFDQAFFSYELGVKKSDLLFFQQVLTKIGNPQPNDVLGTDDDEKNLKVMETAGIQAVLYEGVDKLVEQLRQGGINYV